MEQALEYTPNKTETVRFLGTYDVAALKQKVLDLDEDLDFDYHGMKNG